MSKRQLKIKIADKEFILNPFTIDQAIEIEDNLGCSLEDVMRHEEFSYRKKFMFAVLKTIEPETTEEWLGKNFLMSDGEVYFQLINFMFTSSAPKKKKEEPSG